MENISGKIYDFNNAVTVLSAAISCAGIAWSDEKYFELANSIRNISNMSAAVLQAGDKLQAALDEFDSEANGAVR